MTNQRFRVPGALAPRLEEPGVSVPAVLRRDGLAQGTFEQTRIRKAHNPTDLVSRDFLDLPSPPAGSGSPQPVSCSLKDKE